MEKEKEKVKKPNQIPEPNHNNMLQYNKGQLSLNEDMNEIDSNFFDFEEIGDDIVEILPGGDDNDVDVEDSEAIVCICGNIVASYGKSFLLNEYTYPDCCMQCKQPLTPGRIKEKINVKVRSDTRHILYML